MERMHTGKNAHSKMVQHLMFEASPSGCPASTQRCNLWTEGPFASSSFQIVRSLPYCQPQRRSVRNLGNARDLLSVSGRFEKREILRAVSHREVRGKPCDARVPLCECAGVCIRKGEGAYGSGRFVTERSLPCCEPGRGSARIF